MVSLDDFSNQIETQKWDIYKTHGDLRDIRAHVVHLHKTANQLILFRGSMKIVVRAHNPASGGMDVIDVFGHNVVPEEDLNISACNRFIERGIRAIFDWLHAALRRGVKSE